MSAKRLLLLPGLLCDETVWLDQIAGLGAAVDCTVASYGTLSSIEAMARHVLDSAPAGAFAVAGHSMGGRVALEMARIAPERVERLALMDTGYQGRSAGLPGESEQRGRERLLEIARTQGMRAMGEAWAPGMVHPSQIGTPLFGAILDMIGRKTPEIYAAQIQALLGRPDATALLGRINCPTLLMCGRDDTWSPLSRHEEMQAAMPGSKLVVIEHSGHMVTMEQPGAVNDALAAWLVEPATRQSA